MKRLELKKVASEIRIGDRTPILEPNIFEDCILCENGEEIGFYIKDLREYSDKLTNLMKIADLEFRSARVPKLLLERSDVFQAVYKDGKTRKQARAEKTIQYSTIIGSIPPKPQLRRPYASYSSAHNVETAKPFIKSMILAASEVGKIINEVVPSLYAKQLENVSRIPKKWLFSDIYTSSISNFNISAPYHQDHGNVVGSMNTIITKRQNSSGGCLHVPDYDAVFEQPDNSMLVYPAWRNCHGVTPIVQTHSGGYRNSLIFYALKAFLEK